MKALSGKCCRLEGTRSESYINYQALYGRLGDVSHGGIYMKKGLWPRVIRSVGEIYFEANSTYVDLDQNLKEEGMKDIQCFNYGKKGHIRRECLDFKRENPNNKDAS